MPDYKIQKVTTVDQVPDWERRPPKWAELVDAVLALEPNQTLEVFFDDPKVAERARNAVRDMANLKANAPIVRTRILYHQGETGEGALIYLMKTNPPTPQNDKEESK